MSIQVVSFNCTLKSGAGDFIGSTIHRNAIIANDGEGCVLQGLVRGFQNMIKGERRFISVFAEEAYGQYQQQKIILFPKRKLPRPVSVGEFVSVTGKSGTLRTYKVLQFHNDMVRLDGNHPLAGQDLIFEIEVISVRKATQVELTDSKNNLSNQKFNE